MKTAKSNDDIDFEIRFYERILERKGDFVQALIALGDLYTKKGLYEKGLTIDRKLLQLRPEDPYVFYNLSCSYSLVNAIDKAASAMKFAIKNGYRNFVYLENDRDLINLLKDPEFRSYLDQVKQAAKTI